MHVLKGNDETDIVCNVQCTKTAAENYDWQSLPSKALVNVFGNPISSSLAAKSSAERCTTSSRFKPAMLYLRRDVYVTFHESEAINFGALLQAILLALLQLRVPWGWGWLYFSRHLMYAINMHWSCIFTFCVFSAASLRILMSHLNQVHSDDNFKVICGIGDTPDCHKVFTKYNSFYKHIILVPRAAWPS